MRFLLVSVLLVFVAGCQVSGGPSNPDSGGDADGDGPDGDTGSDGDGSLDGDGGDNNPCAWESVYSPTRLDRDFMEAIIPPGTTDWVAFGDNIGVSNDTGATWQVSVVESIPWLVPEYAGGVAVYHDVEFVSASTAFLSSGNDLLKTQDAGGSWDSVFTLDPVNPQYSRSGNLGALHFPTPDVGYAVGNFSKILKTTDGGETWVTLQSDPSTTPYRTYSDVFFFDEQVGFVAGYEVWDILMNFGFDAQVMKTTDGGATWEIHSIGATADFRRLKMQFIDEQTGFLLATYSQSSERVFATVDSGQTWSEIPEDLWKIPAMHWFDAERGILFGGTGGNLGDMKMIGTKDRGQTWDEIPLPPFGPLNERTVMDFAFSDQQDGFSIGQRGCILTTRDGGQTWTVANPEYPRFYTMDFATDETGYASTGYGYFTTVDGGVTWHFAPGSESMLLVGIDMSSERGVFAGYRNQIHILDPRTGSLETVALPVMFLVNYSIGHTEDTVFAAGKGLSPERVNYFLISDDGGLGWESHVIDDGAQYASELEHQGGTFFVLTGDALLVSEDRGENWEIRHAFAPDVPTAIGFIDQHRGVAGVATGEILRTEDGGETWKPIGFDLVEHPHFSDFLVEGDTIYAYGTKDTTQGSFGAIWKSTDAGLSWAKESLPVPIRGLAAMSITDGFVFAAGTNGQILRLRRDAN